MIDYEQNILNFNKQLSFKNIKLVNAGTLSFDKLRTTLSEVEGLKKGGKSFGAAQDKPDGIIIAGMGGSALAGDLVNFLAKDYELKIPVVVWKDYGLPRTNFKNPLFIAVSFSGNTEETTSAFRESRKYKLRAVVTSGGKLKELALKNNAAAALFSAGDLLPRQSLGLIFYGVAAIIRLKFPEFKIPEFSGLRPVDFKQKGRGLAVLLKGHAYRQAGRIPVVYSSVANKTIAYNWKIRFNETAKLPSFYNVLPEMNHNEIVGFQNGIFSSKIFAIFLNDSNDNLRVKERFKITEKLLKEKGVVCFDVILSGRGILEKFWKAIMMADWTAFYLAKLLKTDPSATPIIEQIKKSIAK